MGGPARTRAERALVRGTLVAAVALAGLLSGRAAQAAAPAPVPSVGAPAARPEGAPPAETPAREETEAAAALRATQELEVRVIEMRRELDALERQRDSWDDLRHRLDELDARQAEAGRPPDGRDAEYGAMDDARSPVRFGGGGLVVRSPDNRFLLRPGLRLQGRYDGQLAAAGVDDRARPDASAFSVAHAELVLEGHAVHPRFEFRMQLDFAEPRVLKDAFVQWRMARSVALRFGRFKVPYGLQRQYWSGYLEFVDLAQPMAAYALERDVGVMLVGRPLGGRLQVQLAALNGPRAPCPVNAENLACDKVQLAYAVRIVAAPFGPLPLSEGDVEGHARPLLSIGMSAFHGRLPTDARARTGDATAPLDLDGDGRVDDVGVWQVGAELRAVFRGAAIQGEWFGRREQAPGLAADRSFWGAYGQASYFIVPQRLQLAARAGRTELPLYGAAADTRAQRGSAVYEQSAAVSTYAHGHDAKLQVDYTHFEASDARSTPSGHRLRAAVQLAF